MDELWAATRHGSNAGRGFHYQDAVATELAVRAWQGEFPVQRVVPEGHDDVSIELADGWLHVQAKSRREHRGDFSLSDLASVWPHLGKRLALDSHARAALVVERPIDGVEATGFDHPMVDAVDLAAREAMARALANVDVEVDDFLARSHVLVKPAPATTTLRLLAEGLQVPSATAAAHLGVLHARLTQLADLNGRQPPHDPAALTVADIARLIDDVTEAVDPSALVEAVRDGLCEVVDFSTALRDDEFFHGVDVAIGHVVAGLPAERPMLVSELVAGALRRRVALVIGPSGSGKSALLWLAAYATRHHVRWYRVRRVLDEDVLSLARLVKGLQPSDDAPVGFVVDDLGRDGRAGFDALVSELSGRPGCVVLGACREEDLIVVASAVRAAQLRPVLDESLAERLWSELRSRSATGWMDWREPFHESGGLLLEYGHLLTQGERLERTIASQVADRLREHRSLEIETLALIATADAFGAEVDAERLAGAIAADSAALRFALARLVDEHLIVSSGGRFGGLHELRSAAAAHAIHRIPPPSLETSVRRLITEVLDSRGLQPFLTRVMEHDAVSDDAVISALAARFGTESGGEPTALAAALHALRVVAFRRDARAWRTILNEEEVSATDVGIVSHFAMTDADTGLFPPAIQRAVARLRALPETELRPALLKRLGEGLNATLRQTADVSVRAAVLASLADTADQVEVEASAIVDELPGDLDLTAAQLLLESAAMVSTELASNVATHLGGSPRLLERLERERPWVRDVRLDEDAGLAVASAEYAFVAESAQPDPHGEVVALCSTLLALTPAAKVARCTAVDATGQAAGLDFPLAQKAIERDSLPTPARVAWNRARTRAAVSAVASATVTEHLAAARDIVVRTAAVVRAAGDAWVAGRAPDQELIRQATELAEADRALRPPPLAGESAGPLELGELPDVLAVTHVSTMVTGNLLLSLFRGNDISPLAAELAKGAARLRDPEYWTLLDQPPLDAVEELIQGLDDVATVSGERARGRAFDISLEHSPGITLGRAARMARRRGERRLAQEVRTLRDQLTVAGFEATVAQREAGETLIVLEISDIASWLERQLELASRCREVIPDERSFWMAPAMNGQIIASHSVHVIRSVFPDPETIRTWPEPPLPLAHERLGDAFREALGAITEGSGIASTWRGDFEPHPAERAAFETAIGRVESALRIIDDLANETHDELVADVRSAVVELWEILEDELTTTLHGTAPEATIAGAFVELTRGRPTELMAVCVEVAAACAEWDTLPA